AIRSQDRLRMELDADDRELTMADGHDLTVVGRRADLELVGNARRGEGVVAPPLQRLGQARKESPAVVRNLARLPVHEPPRLPDLAAEGLDDGLVAEADAE